jgi:hypothetical protein
MTQQPRDFKVLFLRKKIMSMLSGQKILSEQILNNRLFFQEEKR